MEKKYQNQLNKVKSGNPTINLARPCKVGDGILKIEESNLKPLEKEFDKLKESKIITFFIPASGSGSRMFSALYEYLNSTGKVSDETTKFISKFLNNINDFAFYNKLTSKIKLEIKKNNFDIKNLISHLLLEEGLNLGSQPKGLIPFHRYGKFIINPFQEHIIQGAKIGGDYSQFHFTVDENHQKEIRHTIEILREITGIDFHFFFSQQNEESHSTAFDEDLKLAYDSENNLIKRPAGHGTLIENLNTIDSDLIFIKNIDNVQHYSKAKTSISTRKVLAAKLIHFQKSVFNLLNNLKEDNNNYSDLATIINNEFDLKLSQDQLSNKPFLNTYFNRPIRICGMVKNQGQPGGGPFWIKNKSGLETKQIIEKSQIASEPKQLSILLHATHFNPVDIICAIKDFNGEKFDLKNYADPNQYFLVEKQQEGKNIKYIEQPGLWNGGMEDWITLFYEIDSNCFSPVKTVLDLLDNTHNDKT